jgi:quinol-cytochrome oxidoreductase complex cytochrome b subunit
MIGVTLFALVLFESFLGVSLPADQLGGTGLRQADSLLLSIPLLRTALGIAVITLFTVVWAATWTAHPVVLYGLRVAVLVLPPLAYAVTPAVCRARGR